MDLITAIYVAFIWALANRFWGWKHGDRPTPVGMIGLTVYVAMLRISLDPIISLFVAASCAAGFFLGRLTDGVRDSFFAKGLRGWKYSMIYVGSAIAVQSFIPLLPLLFFWQSGAIFWLCRRITPEGLDFVPMAEIMDGFVRGLIFTAAMILAAHHPMTVTMVAKILLVAGF